MTFNVVTQPEGSYSGTGSISSSGALTATTAGSFSGVNFTTTWHGAVQLNGAEAIGSGT